jgi:GGDEF domain-containing protein
MHTSECTQLQASLKLEMSRRWRLELEVFDARSALAMAHTQLARTEGCEQRARHQAMHDGLTALPNRAYFTEQLDRTLSSMGQAHDPRANPAGHALAVLFLDLDGFKCINDTHGHFIGDEVLSVSRGQAGQGRAGR